MSTNTQVYTISLDVINSFQFDAHHCGYINIVLIYISKFMYTNVISKLYYVYIV